MTLDGCVALVTGGAKRIGRAIAEELASHGCHIALHYRNSRVEAEETVAAIRKQERRATGIQADVNNEHSWRDMVQQTVDELGGLDILVNNASVFLDEAPPAEGRFDPAIWQETLRVNLVAPAALCHHAFPHLKRGGGGRIVNLCDIGSERPWPNHLAYCASKAGLDCLTRGLAKAFAPKVNVNGIALGTICFPDRFTDAQREQLLNRVPLQRSGSVEDVAKLVRFVVESGDYMTGEIIRLDGGRSVV